MNVWISYLIDCMAAFEPECRFDVIEVYLDKEGKKLTRLNHMKEAF